MSWIRESGASRLHTFVTSVLKTGPMPKHVAIIMDGNRRFARKKNFDRAKGHLLGFDRLAETLEWCLDLGILEVTIYAFSIENFKRSQAEVDGLMELARQKFEQLLQEKDLINKHGVCFRVLGNISLLPADLQRMIAEGVHMTRNNDRAILNVCFSYTSRDEMTHAVSDIAEGVSKGLVRESDVNEELFEKCLYTSRSEHPDLLLRTSGEVRLSDFLLWQTSYTPLSFMQVLWPEFSRWHLYAAVLYYQRQRSAILNARAAHQLERERLQDESDIACLLRETTIKSVPTLTPNISYSSIHHSVSQYEPLYNAAKQVPVALPSPVDSTELKQYRADRLSRVDKFLTYLARRNDAEISKLLSNTDCRNERRAEKKEDDALLLRA